MPDISIILAVYNVEKYLKQCLESLINQTFKNIEIICINDGSTDNSLNILKEYQEKDSRIKIVKQENRGPGVARNKGLELASGKYIMIVDPDDWLELNACELAYNQIERNNNDFVMFDYVNYIDKTQKYIKGQNHFLPYKDVINNPNINLLKLETNIFQNGYSWGKIYKKSFLEKHSIKYGELYLCEDIQFTLIANLLSKSFSISNIPLYVYRLRNDSCCSNNKNWKDLITSRKYVYDFIIKNKFDNDILKKYAEYSYSSLIFWYSKFQQKELKKEFFKYYDMLPKNKSIRHIILYYIFKFNLEHFYYIMVKPVIYTLFNCIRSFFGVFYYE